MRFPDSSRVALTPPPVKGFFGWIYAAWEVSDNDIFARSGLEAVLYIKSLRYMFRHLLLIGLLCLIFLLPVNTMGKYHIITYINPNNNIHYHPLN